MGLFAKFKAGLQKTHSKLAHEIKRIITRSPRLDAHALEEIEAAFADCLVRTDEARALLVALFPKQPSAIWPVL